VISPLRVDVLIAGFVLAVPVLLLGLRGDLGAHDVALRMVWCLVAGWTVVGVLRFAVLPRTPAPAGRGGAAEPSTDSGPAAR
jgi:hypothetical protein